MIDKLNIETKLRIGTLESRIKELEAELAKACRQCEAELRKQGELLRSRDNWKGVAETLGEAIRAYAILRVHNTNAEQAEAVADEVSKFVALQKVLAAYDSALKEQGESCNTNK